MRLSLWLLAFLALLATAAALNAQQKARLEYLLRLKAEKERVRKLNRANAARATTLRTIERGHERRATSPPRTPKPVPRTAAPRTAAPRTAARPTKTSADDKFLQCCQQHPGVHSGCYKYCNYHSFNQGTLTGIFLGQTTCDRKKIGGYLWCLGSGQDHTACCRARNVHTTAAGSLCTDFCNLSPGARFNGIGYGHMPCWATISSIGGCFRDYKLNH